MAGTGHPDDLQQWWVSGPVPAMNLCTYFCFPVTDHDGIVSFMKEVYYHDDEKQRLAGRGRAPALHYDYTTPFGGPR